MWRGWPQVLYGQEERRSPSQENSISRVADAFALGWSMDRGLDGPHVTFRWVESEHPPAALNPAKWGPFCVHAGRYKMNLALDELKEQWRVEKAALELADAQNDIKDVSSNTITK